MWGDRRRRWWRGDGGRRRRGLFPRRGCCRFAGWRIAQHPGRNFVVGERVANDLRIAGADGFGRIEVRISAGAERIVDGCAAHAEIAGDFSGRGNRFHHRVCFGVAQALIVDEEKSLGVHHRAAEGRAEIVLDEKF